MSDITKIKVDGEPESSYQLYPRNEEFAKRAGGNAGSQSGCEITTLHINITAVNTETMEATFTADKTPLEMQQASTIGPTWCVITIAAGIMVEEAVSFGVPPAWYGGSPAFGISTDPVHIDNGNNTSGCVVRSVGSDKWIVDIARFGG